MTGAKGPDTVEWWAAKKDGVAMLQALVAAIFVLSGSSADNPRPSMAQSVEQDSGTVDAASVADDPLPLGADAKGEEGATPSPAEPRPLELGHCGVGHSASTSRHTCSLAAHSAACSPRAGGQLSVQITFCAWRS